MDLSQYFEESVSDFLMSSKHLRYYCKEQIVEIDNFASCSKIPKTLIKAVSSSSSELHRCFIAQSFMIDPKFSQGFRWKEDPGPHHYQWKHTLMFRSGVALCKIFLFFTSFNCDSISKNCSGIVYPWNTMRYWTLHYQFKSPRQNLDLDQESKGWEE